VSRTLRWGMAVLIESLLHRGPRVLGTAGATVGSMKGVAAFYGASALGGTIACGLGATAGADLLVVGSRGRLRVKLWEFW
jgi:hypothetical protein